MKTRDLVIAGLMIAIAAILAQFPLMGSIGLDAMPAYFGAAAIGPMVGGLVGAIAHMLIGTVAGFPLTLPIHMTIAVTMFISCYVYGFTRVKWNRYVAVVAGIIMNGPVSLAASAAVAAMLGGEFGGVPMFMMLVGPLTIASAVNVILADVLYGLIGQVVMPKSGRSV